TVRDGHGNVVRTVLEKECRLNREREEHEHCSDEHQQGRYIGGRELIPEDSSPGFLALLIQRKGKPRGLDFESGRVVLCIPDRLQIFKLHCLSPLWKCWPPLTCQ